MRQRYLLETMGLPDDFYIWDALQDIGVTDRYIAAQRSTMIPVKMTDAQVTKMKLKYDFIWFDKDDTDAEYSWPDGFHR